MKYLFILFCVLATSIAFDLVLNQDEKSAINKFESVNYDPNMFVIKTLMTDAWLTIFYDDYDTIYSDKTGMLNLALNRPNAQYFNKRNDTKLIDFLSEYQFSLNDKDSPKTDVKTSNGSNNGSDLMLINQYENQIFSIVTADGLNVVCYKVNLTSIDILLYFDNITSSCNKLFTLDETDCVPQIYENKTDQFKLKIPCGSYQYMTGQEEDLLMETYNKNSDNAKFRFSENPTVFHNISHISDDHGSIKSDEWYIVRAYGTYTTFWYYNPGDAALTDSAGSVLQTKTFNGSSYDVIFINFWGFCVDPVSEKFIDEHNCGYFEVQYI